MNSAVGRKQGIGDSQMADLANFDSSSAFSAIEKAVLRYAEGMTSTPAVVSDEVFNELAIYFSTAQIVELTGAIALENFRSRFNRAFKIESDGFCELPVNHPVRLAMPRP
ncbi:MAG: carboxymuconolactone decarboxylase family protein [Candidatus Binataceae bacterium]